VLIVAVDIIFY